MPSPLDIESALKYSCRRDVVGQLHLTRTLKDRLIAVPASTPNPLNAPPQQKPLNASMQLLPKCCEHFSFFYTS